MNKPPQTNHENSELRLILDQHEHVCTLLEKEILHLQNSVNHFTDERNRYQRKIEGLDAHIESLDSEVKSLSRERDLIRAQHAKQLNSFQSTIESIRKNHESSLDRLETARADHDRLTEERNALQEKVDSHSATVDQIRAEHASRVAELKQRHQAMSHESALALKEERNRTSELVGKLENSQLKALRSRSILREHQSRRSTEKSLSGAEIAKLHLELIRYQYSELVRSRCWRLGNRTVRLIEILLLRWRKVLVTEHIQNDIETARQTDWNRLTKDSIKVLAHVSKDLEKNLQVLFQSKRWSVGRQLYSPWVNDRNKRNLNNLPAQILTETKLFKTAVATLADDQPDQKLLPPVTTVPGMISVIMPVYNGVGHVEQAIASVLTQSYAHWELLCVDDCSADQTLLALDATARQDSRVQVLAHEKNCGKGAARNTGTSLARGEYIFFLDADDWLDQRAFEYLIDQMRRDNVDMVFGQTFKVRDDTGERFEGIHQEYQHQEIHAQKPCERPVLLRNAIVCNKLIKRQFLVDTDCWQFNEKLNRFEDTDLTMRWYIHAPLISMCRKPTYFYRQHVGDINCRSNRKPGGVKKAPLFRIQMARAILRYRAGLAVCEDRVVLLDQLLLIMKVLNQINEDYFTQAWQVAKESARTLRPTDLKILSPEVRDFFDRLRTKDFEDSVNLLVRLAPKLRNWKPNDLQS